jgi:hypothetical protein
LPGTLHAATLQSGVDNGAAYEDMDASADFYADRHLMRQFDVGASALYVSECAALVELAAVAAGGRARGQQRGAAVAAAMEAMWNEAEGVYENTRFNGSFHKRRMPTAFYPMLSTPTGGRAAGCCRRPCRWHSASITPLSAPATPTRRFCSNSRAAAAHALCALRRLRCRRAGDARATRGNALRGSCSSPPRPAPHAAAPPVA